MLTIHNLHASVEGREILRGINLTVNAGEVHAIMGPNGSGKSTLAGVLAGRDAYDVTEGEVLFEGKDLLDMDPEERAREGLFLAFQYPVEIPGVSNTYFLRAAVNADPQAPRPGGARRRRSSSSSSRQKMKILHIDEDLLKRPVNEGFSGGEKKRNEIFQMAVLEPKLCILDETDSGLDIDALRIVADGVNALRSPERGHPGHHALPAAAELHRAGHRARALRRPHRQVGRQGAGPGAGGQGLRLDRTEAKASEGQAVESAFRRASAA